MIGWRIDKKERDEGMVDWMRLETSLRLSMEREGWKGWGEG